MSEKRLKLLPEEGDILVGRYRLNEEVGRGGFGVVFRATQLGLDEDVAIKVVRPHVIDDDGLRARFEREIFIAKQLRHPNTIRILDVSHTDKGLPFLVMEFVEGEALAETLEVEGRLNVARTRHIAIQVLKGLAEAHSKGVVHRDLKPENILLCNFFGEPDFVKILDFGIAKALTGPVGKLTQTNALLGTPNYMSPEQALGSRDLDGRSDLYAVGLIMAECLTGRPVVEGDSVLRVVATHASPEPLVLKPEVLEGALGPVIRKALEKDPVNRFPAAREMLEALAATGYDRPVSSPPGPTLDSPRTRRLETPPDVRPLQTPPTLRMGSSPSPEPPGLPYAGREVALSDTAAAVRPNSAVDAEPTVRTATHPELLVEPRPRVAGPQRRGWLVPLGLVVGLGGIIGALAFGPFGGRPDAEPSDQPAVAAPAPPEPDSPEAPVAVALPETPGQETLEAVPTAADPAASPAPGSWAASLNFRHALALWSELLTAERGVATAMAIANERLGAALPPVHPLRFEGARGVEVRMGNHVAGVTPFEAPVPRVAHAIQVTLVRRGLPDEQVEVHLDQDVYEVASRGRRQGNVRREDSRPEREERQTGAGETETTPATPGIPGNLFGNTPLDDSVRRDEGSGN